MSALAEHRNDSAAGEDAAESVADEVFPSPSGGSEVVQDAPDSPRVDSPRVDSLRSDFGAHLEAHYPRLVAQLYAITLDSGEAHDAVQDAYSRAWRNWAEIGRGPDATGWVRRVAVRSTQRSWRRVLARFGFGRPRPTGEGGPRTAAVLGALGRLSAAERRAVVLYHMVGMSVGEIAALERTSEDTVRSRLGRAHQVVTEGMADALPSVLGLPDQQPDDDYDRYGTDRYGDGRLADEERY